MASQNDYYGNVDLRYAEVGIAMQKIDRMNPGRVKFSIPTLTPAIEKEDEYTQQIVQKDKTNIVNDNPDAVDVSNIEITNVLYIEIPVELCGLPGAYYDITGRLDANQDGSNSGTLVITGSVTLEGSLVHKGTTKYNGNIYGHTYYYGIPSASMSGTGSLSGNCTFTGSGTIRGNTLGSTGRGAIDVRNIAGTIGLELNEKSRYIEEGSRWLIMFLGGDISAPVVVCRLPNDAAIPKTQSTIDEPIEYEQIDANADVPEYGDQLYFTDVDDDIVEAAAESGIEIKEVGKVDYSQHIQSKITQKAVSKSTAKADEVAKDVKNTIYEDQFPIDFNDVTLKVEDESTIITDNRLSIYCSAEFIPYDQYINTFMGCEIYCNDGFMTIELNEENESDVSGIVRVTYNKQ